MVPSGFDAYVRVLHPLRTEHGSERWADRAARNGRIVHPEMQLHLISRPAGTAERLPGSYEPGPGFDTELGESLRLVLATILRSHTTTPDHCWFCYWEGRGGLDDQGVAERVELPARRYLLAEGAVEAAGRSSVPRPVDCGPNLWWPDDRAWVVASEIDYAWTYVGGSYELAEELLAEQRLEVLPAKLSHLPFYDSDLLNASLDGPPRDQPRR